MRISISSFSLLSGFWCHFVWILVSRFSIPSFVLSVKTVSWLNRLVGTDICFLSVTFKEGGFTHASHQST